MTEVVCANQACKFSFGAYPNGMEPEGERQPCPNCGQLGRTVLKEVSSSITVRGSVEYGAFPAGTKSNRKRFAWGFVGWDWSSRLKRLVQKDSHFDKKGNRRYEHVVDPVTGKALHHQDHPLTDHIGRGSDKKRRTP